MRSVDTNILVRAFARDEAAQLEVVESLFENDQLYVPITVVLELEWVLRARFSFAPSQIAKALEYLANLGNVLVGERAAVLAAVEKVKAGWDFADALHHALSEGCDDFVSVDADLIKRGKRIAGLSPPVVKP